MIPDRLDPTKLWHRDDVSDPSRWEVPLDDAVNAELRAHARRLERRTLASLTPADVVDAVGPALAKLGARLRSTLRDDHGFVLLRGFDTRGPADEVERAYAVLGLALGGRSGGLAPQNVRGERLTHVRDTGADPNALETRLYTTRAAQDFHTDGADVIGLLCLHRARSGGESLLASSVAIVDAIRCTRADLYPILFAPFPWHYQEPGQPPRVFLRPICTVVGSSARGVKLHTFFIPWYLRRSQEIAEAPRLSSAQDEVIALVESLANDPRFHVTMRFEPGDVQWLANASILHKREAYEDDPDPARKRHLLRLWVSAPDLDASDPTLRDGIPEVVR